VSEHGFETRGRLRKCWSWMSRKTRKKQMGKTVVRHSWLKKILPYAVAFGVFSVCVLIGFSFFTGRSPEWFNKSKSLLSAGIVVVMLAFLIRFRTQTTK
jgi:protein-S-isoprenylcysteine O-methyltransferase Ste14